MMTFADTLMMRNIFIGNSRLCVEQDYDKLHNPKDFNFEE